MKLRNFANILVFHSEIQDQSVVADFACIFWCKISFISENKSKRNIQTPTFAKISIGKNIAA